jgi:hypothetical protein
VACISALASGLFQAVNTPEPFEHEWQPATSRPGELYTVEGEARARWSFLSGLRYPNPRSAAYRRQMLRTGALVIGIGLLVIAAVIVVVALVG